MRHTYLSIRALKQCNPQVPLDLQSASSHFVIKEKDAPRFGRSEKKEGFERFESCPFENKQVFFSKLSSWLSPFFEDGGSGVNIAGESAPEPPSPFKGAVSLTA